MHIRFETCFAIAIAVFEKSINKTRDRVTLVSVSPFIFQILIFWNRLLRENASTRLQSCDNSALSTYNYKQARQKYAIYST